MVVGCAYPESLRPDSLTPSPPSLSLFLYPYPTSATTAHCPPSQKNKNKAGLGFQFLPAPLICPVFPVPGLTLDLHKILIDIHLAPRIMHQKTMP